MNKNAKEKNLKELCFWKIKNEIGWLPTLCVLAQWQHTMGKSWLLCALFSREYSVGIDMHIPCFQGCKTLQVFRNFQIFGLWKAKFTSHHFVSLETMFNVIHIWRNIASFTFLFSLTGALKLIFVKASWAQQLLNLPLVISHSSSWTLKQICSRNCAVTMLAFCVCVHFETT